MIYVSMGYNDSVDVRTSNSCRLHILDQSSGRCLKSVPAAGIYQYFLFAVNSDLQMRQGNVVDGIHAGSLGGCWQAVVNGFGGMTIHNGMLHFSPRLPGHWKRLRFSVKWQGGMVTVTVTRKQILLQPVRYKSKRPIELEVYGERYSVVPGDMLIVDSGR